MNKSNLRQFNENLLSKLHGFGFSGIQGSNHPDSDVNVSGIEVGDAIPMVGLNSYFSARSKTIRSNPIIGIHFRAIQDLVRKIEPGSDVEMPFTISADLISLSRRSTFYSAQEANQISTLEDRILSDFKEFALPFLSEHMDIKRAIGYLKNNGIWINKGKYRIVGIWHLSKDADAVNEEYNRHYSEGAKLGVNSLDDFEKFYKEFKEYICTC